MGRKHLGKTRINIKIAPDLLRRVDAQAGRRRMDRSQFIATAMAAMCDSLERKAK